MHRTVFFLPGAGADPAFWRPLGDRLPGDWEKRYLAWPGLGHQPSDPTVSRFDDLVGLVERALPNSGTVDLVAQSLGGAVALRIALRQPSRVRRLVLTATSGGLDVARWGAADWRPAYRQEYPSAAAWIADPVPSLWAELGQVCPPTLLLWGGDDPISPVGVGEALRSQLPHAVLHVVPGADHGFGHARAAELVDLVTEWLR